MGHSMGRRRRKTRTSTHLAGKSWKWEKVTLIWSRRTYQEKVPSRARIETSRRIKVRLRRRMWTPFWTNSTKSQLEAIWAVRTCSREADPTSQDQKYWMRKRLRYKDWLVVF